MLNTVLLLATSMVVGQAGGALPPHQHLKDLEYFVGDWKIDGTVEVEGDFSGLDEVTKTPLRLLMSYEWFKNKNFMVVTVRDKPEGPIEYQATIGWDPKKKQIRSVDFNYQGAWMKYIHIQRDFGWVMEGTSIYPDGAEGPFRAEIRITDDDHYRNEGKGTMVKDGKKSVVKVEFDATRQ